MMHAHDTVKSCRIVYKQATGTHPMGILRTQDPDPLQTLRTDMCISTRSPDDFHVYTISRSPGLKHTAIRSIEDLNEMNSIFFKNKTAFVFAKQKQNF